MSEFANKLDADLKNDNGLQFNADSLKTYFEQPDYLKKTRESWNASIDGDLGNLEDATKTELKSAVDDYLRNKLTVTQKNGEECSAVSLMSIKGTFTEARNYVKDPSGPDAQALNICAALLSLHKFLSTKSRLQYEGAKDYAKQFCTPDSTTKVETTTIPTETKTTTTTTTEPSVTTKDIPVIKGMGLQDKEPIIGEVTSYRPQGNKVEYIENNKEYQLGKFEFPSGAKGPILGFLVLASSGLAEDNEYYEIQTGETKTSETDTYRFAPDGTLTIKTNNKDALPKQITFMTAKREDGNKKPENTDFNKKVISLKKMETPSSEKKNNVSNTTTNTNNNTSIPSDNKVEVPKTTTTTTENGKDTAPVAKEELKKEITPPVITPKEVPKVEEERLVLKVNDELKANDIQGVIDKSFNTESLKKELKLNKEEEEAFDDGFKSLKKESKKLTTYEDKCNFYKSALGYMKKNPYSIVEHRSFNNKTKSAVPTSTETLNSIDAGFWEKHVDAVSTEFAKRENELAKKPYEVDININNYTTSPDISKTFNKVNNEKINLSNLNTKKVEIENNIFDLMAEKNRLIATIAEADAANQSILNQEDKSKNEKENNNNKSKLTEIYIKIKGEGVIGAELPGLGNINNISKETVAKVLNNQLCLEKQLNNTEVPLGIMQQIAEAEKKVGDATLSYTTAVGVDNDNRQTFETQKETNNKKSIEASNTESNLTESKLKTGIQTIEDKVSSINKVISQKTEDGTYTNDPDSLLTDQGIRSELLEEQKTLQKELDNIQIRKFTIDQKSLYAGEQQYGSRIEKIAADIKQEQENLIALQNELAQTRTLISKRDEQINKGMESGSSIDITFLEAMDADLKGLKIKEKELIGNIATKNKEKEKLERKKTEETEYQKSYLLSIEYIETEKLLSILESDRMQNIQRVKTLADSIKITNDTVKRYSKEIREIETKKEKLEKEDKNNSDIAVRVATNEELNKANASMNAEKKKLGNLISEKDILEPKGKALQAKIDDYKKQLAAIGKKMDQNEQLLKKHNPPQSFDQDARKRNITKEAPVPKEKPELEVKSKPEEKEKIKAESEAKNKSDAKAKIELDAKAKAHLEAKGRTKEESAPKAKEETPEKE